MKKIKTISIHAKNQAVPLDELIRFAIRKQDKTKKGASGAVVTFTGIVRNDSGVSFLDYESCKREAERALRRIVAEEKTKFGLNSVVIHHVTGCRLCPGECVLQVVVTSPHRREAFAACKKIVDRMKREVPIWKKEHFNAKGSGKKAHWVH